MADPESPWSQIGRNIKLEGLSDVASISTKLQNTLIQYHSIEEDEWRVAKKVKDVTVWRKPSEEFNGYLYKAQGVMDDVVNNVIDHIRPGPWRLDWDRLMTSLDVLEHFEEYHRHLGKRSSLPEHCRHPILMREDCESQFSDIDLV
uniref:StAR related lipid transfer domain containing 4 n=1 Tax=Mus spicilegus TaxID=10103 RepID=A0A8C6MPM7_MUSSI